MDTNLKLIRQLTKLYHNSSLADREVIAPALRRAYQRHDDQQQATTPGRISSILPDVMQRIYARMEVKNDG